MASVELRSKGLAHGDPLLHRVKTVCIVDYYSVDPMERARCENEDMRLER